MSVGTEQVKCLNIFLFFFLYCMHHIFIPPVMRVEIRGITIRCVSRLSWQYLQSCSTSCSQNLVLWYIILCLWHAERLPCYCGHGHSEGVYSFWKISGQAGFLLYYLNCEKLKLLWTNLCWYFIISQCVLWKDMIVIFGPGHSSGTPS